MRTRSGAAFAALLLGAAVVFWFGLGMHRGLLLSEDVKSRCWPWAPFFPRTEIQAPALSDPVWQFVPWLELARAELAAGRLPLWNPHQSGGVPLLGNDQSALASPLIWPALLAGVASGWNLSLLLRLVLAFGSAFLWLRDLGRSAAAAALGGVAYGLSGPFVAWLEHPETTTAAAFPLVLLFSSRLAARPTRRDFVGLALATALVMTGGQPEVQVIAAIIAAAWLIRETLSPRRLLSAASAALLGAGLTAAVLFPFVEYFRASAARFGVDRRPFVLPLRDLARFVEPRLPGSNVIEAAATVSVTALVLAAAGLWRIRRDGRAAFWAGGAAIALLATYDNPASRALALHTPVYWTRFLLFLPLPLGYLASGALDAVTARWRERGRPAAAAIVGTAVVLAAAAELVLAAQGVHGSSRPEDLRTTTPLLRRLQADSDAFRILPLHTFLSPDSATLYGLDDVRGYDALGPLDWRRELEKMGRVVRLPTQFEVLEPWDLVPGGAALDEWNVRYLLLHPHFGFGAAELNARKGLDLEEVYAGPDGRILRNRRARPRARLAGPGRVEVESRHPGRWAFRVEAGGPDVLTVADPMFPGWAARLDGRAVDLPEEPGLPMRVAVPAGTHRVDLLYRPASFRWGAAVAALSAILLAAAARRFPAASAAT